MPLSRPGWQILQELSEVVGHDLGFRTLEDIQREAAPLLGEREVDLAGIGGSASGAAPAEAEDGDGDGTGLLLFTYPLLVDEGTLSRQAVALKEALGEPAFVEVHPDDAERLGLSDGGTATITTPAGSTGALPVRVTPNIAPGTAFVPFNNPGLQANTLLSGRFTATATLAPGAA